MATLAKPIKATSEFLTFTPEEQELLTFVLQAEEFRFTAWEKYGPDWVDHIPTAINAFIWYYFKTSLFPWHLAMYYCPVAEATAHGGRGAGKAQPLDAKVMTPTGWRLMGDLRVGDQVMGANGHPATVLGVYPQGIKSIYRLTTSDGSSTECTEDHLWSVYSWYRRPRKTQRVLALRDFKDDLRHGSQGWNYHIPTISPMQFPTVVLPIDPYLLGLLIGDGGLTTETLRFTTADDELLESIRDLMPVDLELQQEVGSRYDYRLVRATVNGNGKYNPLITELRNLGLWGKGSDQKYVPALYLYASADQRLALLQGLLDTDGSVGKRGVGCEFCSVSRKLADDVVFLVRSLGGSARLAERTTHYTYKNEKRDGAISYRVTIGLPDNVTPFRLERKRCAMRKLQCMSTRRAIVDISYVGEKEAQCICVDTPDHLYITDDFLPTHNTVGMALAMAAYHALHPGEDWLHVSITKDQATRTYAAIMQHGDAGTDVSFVKRFVSEHVTSPFPEIRLRSWGPGDPGTIIRFRSIGNDDGIDRLRSFEAGTVTADEAFRMVPNANTYPQLRGCIRGINRVRLGQLPQSVQDELEGLIRLSLNATTEKDRKRYQDKLTKLAREQRVQKRGFMALYGNAGPHDWEWVRHDRARTDPQHYFSYTTSSWDNPFITEEQRQDMERQFDGNRELIEVEMHGRRPRNLGDVFAAHHISGCTDLTAKPLAQRMMDNNEPDWIWREHVDFNCFHYQKPPEAGHAYICGADPGAGLAPNRNKWTIFVFDRTTPRPELVYFEMGHLQRRTMGDFRPFWQRLRYIRDKYPFGTGDLWVDSTGTQKGMTQLAFPEDLAVVPVSFVGDKIVLINKLKAILEAYKMFFPDIPQMIIELGNYMLDDKELNQDCVSGLICAAGALWQYLDLDYVLRPVEEYNEVVVEHDRYARTLER